MLYSSHGNVESLRAWLDTIKYMKKIWIFIVAFICLGELAIAFTIKSTAFNNAEFIPKQYTCMGANISPPLKWDGAPENVKSYAFIMDDPDTPAGTWVHWILYNIPPNVQSFDENLRSLPEGSTLGANSWNENSYGGPCPPSGTHRYFFKLYALDNVLDSVEHMNKTKLEKAIEGHIIATTTLMGKYAR